ncbi:hypothetical protein BDY21DRAFT_291752 [Lineolata rhizophorae]|uniref:Mitochondrial distribution and morphology protein 34 n=1 Tax=Lineolata rhizophorae TaxID=578093 RepID=A0A6A6NQP1_9PEZI|nr:hypothetical protein BDY21DRAFT_291752 [Lineolata rhizophorae]
MAFNFNWSPLMADTSRARDMLTTALNKSPKPPIIVDDIIVTELNLGSVPPELEILEIGDLAEDRFRGIFKMSYAGDAFLTLKTRVQANPLNTYLSEKPSFASPQPLAAASGLTIPLQITLSDIRLSGFVILVFSRQKGLTLVFRNDPLESLKVSSTFDSIPFVRDYLQKEIEGQLRVLFMDDLPAILHRLSLRLWSPEYRELDDQNVLNSTKESSSSPPIDPLAGPPQDPVDAFGNPLDESQIAAMSIDPQSEIHASFSQKNLLRLAALRESHRTLSLFTPSLRDTVFRAWTGALDRPDHRSGLSTPALLTSHSLSRVHSAVASTESVKSASDAASAAAAADDAASHASSRPSLASLGSSAYYGLGMGAGGHPPHHHHRATRANPHKKRKKRVVNLRPRSKEEGDAASLSSAAIAEEDMAAAEPEERELAAAGAAATPPRSPAGKVRWRSRLESVREASPIKGQQAQAQADEAGPASSSSSASASASRAFKQHGSAPSMSSSSTGATGAGSSVSSAADSGPACAAPIFRSLSADKLAGAGAGASPQHRHGYEGGGILEQAWMMKMAAEIARKVAEEKERGKGGAGRDVGVAGVGSGKGVWAEGEALEDDDVGPPPAYVE